MSTAMLEPGAPDAPFDEAAFSEIARVLGERETAALLRLLLQDLRRRFGGKTEKELLLNENLRNDVHDMASYCGMLGFLGVSHACRTLEREIRTGGDLFPHVLGLREAAEEACRTIEILLLGARCLPDAPPARAAS